MKKTKAVLAITLSTTIFLSACSFGTPRLYDQLSSTSDIQLFGKDIEITYDESFAEKIEKAEQKVRKALEDKKRWKLAFLSDLLDLHDLSSEVFNNYVYAGIYAYATMEKSYFDLETECYDAYFGIHTFFDEIALSVRDTKYASVYYPFYFGYMPTEEELDEKLALLDPDTQKETNTLSTKIMSVQADYTMSDGDDPVSYLKEIVSLGNELATLKGYENYLDYQYAETYDREYTPSDAVKLFDYVKEYVSPVFKSVSRATEDAVGSLDIAQTVSYYQLTDGFFGPNFSTVKKYVSWIGGDLEKHFNYVWDSGNYFFVNQSQNTITAYSYQFANGSPFLFFGENYQNVGTLIHEFGHLNANWTNTVHTFDLLETQSQGNEMLFYSYLSEHSTLNEGVTNAYVLSQMRSILGSLIASTAVNALESYIYTTEDELTYDAISTQYATILNDLQAEGFNVDYWAYPTIMNPGYYVSYATSALSALSVFALAQNDLESAKEAYVKTYDYGEKETYSEIMEYAGLCNALKEDGYILIHDAFLK